MQSEVGNERLMLRMNMMHLDRPDSSKLVDLHVYVMPKEIWKNRQNLAENEAMGRAVSVGFVRVPESLTIHDLRRYIVEICGEDNGFPKEFIYLRSVGRCLTKVKQQQEKNLKVKNYRPPTAFAPEIYILEDCRDNHTLISGEPPTLQLSMNSQRSKKPIEGSSLSYPLLNHNHRRQNSTSIPKIHSIFSAKLSPQDLLKSREEQERLYLRQIELARQRHEIENKENKEEDAAIKIQTAFRNFRDRLKAKQQQEDAATKIGHLRKQTKYLTRQKTEEEHDVVRLSHRLGELRKKRIELEANRELVVRRMQQLHAQITIQRREEKHLWKKKYFIEKNQTTALEERNPLVSKNQTDIHNQLEQATIRLNNTTKLRQQAEYESRLLRHELQQISSTLNAIERYRLPKESPHYQQQQQRTKPISVDITLQY